VGSTGPTEIEVKLGVEDEDVIRALLRSPDPDRLAGFVARPGPHVRVAVDRYLDTRRVDGLLFLCGYRARLRTLDRRTTLTVKGESREIGALTERLELEGPATLRLAPEAWAASSARDRLVELLAGSPGARLRVIASLRQRRTVRVIARGATVVELSLDELTAPATSRGSRRPARRTELEAELLAGDPADLEVLATAMRAIPGLVDPLGSKRDFALAAGRGGNTRLV